MNQAVYRNQEGIKNKLNGREGTYRLGKNKTVIGVGIRMVPGVRASPPEWILDSLFLAIILSGWPKYLAQQSPFFAR
jgi:hypothetical protein